MHNVLLLTLLTVCAGQFDTECESDLLQECLTNGWGVTLDEITIAAVLDCNALQDHWSIAMSCFSTDPTCCTSILVTFDTPTPETAQFLGQCPDFVSVMSGFCNSAPSEPAGTRLFSANHHTLAFHAVPSQIQIEILCVYFNEFSELFKLDY